MNPIYITDDELKKIVEQSVETAIRNMVEELAIKIVEEYVARLEEKLKNGS